MPSPVFAMRSRNGVFALGTDYTADVLRRLADSPLLIQYTMTCPTREYTDHDVTCDDVWVFQATFKQTNGMDLDHVTATHEDFGEALEQFIDACLDYLNQYTQENE